MQHQSGVRVITFNRKGTSLLTGSSDGTARLWEVPTGLPLGQPLPHGGTVTAVCFSPTGDLALTGTETGNASLWDTFTGKPLRSLMRHEGLITTVAFSPDGKTVLTGSQDKTARLWDVPETIPDEPERVRLWVEVLTGSHCDKNGLIAPLSIREWLERQKRLVEIGGPFTAPGYPRKFVP
jgi:WD40 repeat protein